MLEATYHIVQLRSIAASLGATPVTQFRGRVHSKFGCVIITQKNDYKMGIFSTFKSRYLSPGMAHLYVCSFNTESDCAKTTWQK